MFALSQWCVGQKLGYLKDEGVNVKLAQMYPNGGPRLKRGLRSDWDIAFTGRFRPLPRVLRGVCRRSGSLAMSRIRTAPTSKPILFSRRTLTKIALSK